MSAIDRNAEFLRLARAGDQAELIRALETMTLRAHATCSPGIPLHVSDQLRDEALWYARQGDLDEAIYRLSL